MADSHSKSLKLTRPAPGRGQGSGKTQIPDREAQAMREVGQTKIKRAVALILGLIFLVTIGWLAPLDRLTRKEGGLFPAFLSRVAAQVASIPEQGFLAANRRVKREMDRLEDTIEETSWLRRRFVPSVQWRLATTWGLGNEQVYIGRKGWLFYRADVDHVVGRGFLEPAVLRARSRGGELWTAAPQADPLAALQQFADEMKSRGIDTIVMPTPVKPTVDPEPLIPVRRSRGGSSRRPGPADLKAPIRNASFAQFVAALEASGVEVFDPAPILVQAKIDTGIPQFLRTDTHWTPRALIHIARELAARIEEVPGLSMVGTRYRRQTIVLDGYGDVAAMLNLPASQDRIPPERIESQMVLARDGTTWLPDRSAEVLLLGDSFSNVFSDASLGWGTSAGLAEQLSYELGRPVDKIAVNAGGARATRDALQRALAEDEDRLANTRVVVYQFATRELSQGDWQFDGPDR